MIYLILTIFVLFAAANFCLCNVKLKPEPGDHENFGENLSESAGDVSEEDLTLDEKFKGDDAQQLTFLKQCYLVNETRALAEARFKTSGQKPHDKRWPDYSNFTTINGPGPRILGRLLSKAGVQPLFTIKEKDIAGLMPRIRLFKIYDDGHMAELKFPTAYGVLGARNPQASDMFDSTANPGDKAGITKLSYKLAGTNPAEAEKIIQLKLELLFGSMEDFLATRTVKDSGGTQRELGYIDLVKYLGADFENHLTYYEDEFRIKATVGWSQPELSTMSGPLKAAIRSAQTSFFLSLVSHDLNFNQDGTITLEVEYNAYVETAFKNPALDLFWDSGNHKLIELQKEFKNKKRENIQVGRVIKSFDRPFAEMAKGDQEWIENNSTKQIEEARRGGDYGPGGPIVNLPSGTREERVKEVLESRRKEALETNKDKKERIEKELEELKSQLNNEKAVQKIKKYRRILQMLTDKERIFTLFVKQEDAKFFNDSGVSTTKQNIARRLAAKAKSKAGTDLKVKVGDSTDTTEEANKKMKEAATQKPSAKTVKQPDLKSIFEDDGTPPKEGDPYRIPFFYLGDLLDVAIEIVRKHEGKENKIATRVLKEVSILVGPVAFRSNGDLFSIALSELPVSVDYFLIWFQDNVVKRQADTYLVQDFFNDILRQLTQPLFGVGCFDGVKQNTSAHKASISMPKGPKGTPRLPHKGARCSVSDIKTARATSPESVMVNKDLKSTSNVLYFFGKENDPSYMRGDQKQDFENGIYHLALGRDRGLVKKINFSKTDFPGRREALMDLDADTLTAGGLLREKYDVTIDMVGNTLFFPGQYIYIDPLLPGSPKKISTDLGFGGYYFVHEVYHRLKPDQYSTEIKAVWQAFAHTGGPLQEPRPIPSQKTIAGKCQSKNLRDNYSGRGGTFGGSGATGTWDDTGEIDIDISGEQIGVAEDGRVMGPVEENVPVPKSEERTPAEHVPAPKSEDGGSVE